MNCRFYPIKATKFIRLYQKDILLRTASLPSSLLFFLYKISTFKVKFVVTYKEHSYNRTIKTRTKVQKHYKEEDKTGDRK